MCLTIALVEAIRNELDGTCRRREPVYLVWQGRVRSEILQPAVGHVGKVDVLVLWMHGQVVE